MADGNGTSVARLVEAAREGNPGAADRLLLRYRGYLRFLARDRVFTSLKGKVDPSDVVQEVLLDAQRCLVQFRGRSERELLAWLRMILARRLVDLARKHHTPGGRTVVHERSLEEILRESSQALARLLPAEGPTPSRHAAARETSALVAEALAKLSDEQEEVIRLRSIQELGWEEVAERLGRSNAAVRQLWVRALKKLRPLVEGLR
jgi:RNA polymerase sigma-70 factor (ECF subfamily)